MFVDRIPQLFHNVDDSKSGHIPPSFRKICEKAGITTSDEMDSWLHLRRKGYWPRRVPVSASQALRLVEAEEVERERKSSK